MSHRSDGRQALRLVAVARWTVRSTVAPDQSASTRPSLTSIGDGRAANLVLRDTFLRWQYHRNPGGMQ